MSKFAKHNFSEKTYMTRKMFNETQVQYAKRLGVCERTIRNWENEKVEKPRKLNVKKVQRRYRYFKNETKQGIQVKMKRRSDKAVVWSRMRSFDDMFETLSEFDFYKNEYEITGFRRINLMKSFKKGKIKQEKVFTTFAGMMKAYK